MSKYADKLRAEYYSGYWALIDPAEPSNRVRFDQALMDATWVGPGAVEGFVKSVHGVCIEDIERMSNRGKRAIGVTSNHRLGLESYQRIRLNEDGTTERVTQ